MPPSLQGLFDDTVLEYITSISLCDMHLALLLVWCHKKLIELVSEDIDSGSSLSTKSVGEIN